MGASEFPDWTFAKRNEMPNTLFGCYSGLAVAAMFEDMFGAESVDITAQALGGSSTPGKMKPPSSREVDGDWLSGFLAHEAPAKKRFEDEMTRRGQEQAI